MSLSITYHSATATDRHISFSVILPTNYALSITFTIYENNSSVQELSNFQNQICTE